MNLFRGSLPPLLMFQVFSFTSGVKFETSSYGCCGNPGVKFDQKCEHMWKMNDQTFARYDNGIKDCIKPCKEINNDGLIVFDSCINFNVTTFCTNAMGEMEETSTNYLSKECQHSGMYPTQSSILIRLCATVLTYLVPRIFW